MSDEQESSENSGSEPKKSKIGLETVEEEKEPTIVFQFNDEEGEFQELEIEADLPLRELLDSEFILLFVDSERYRVWSWHGINTTTRMKFISAKLAPQIRDQYGVAYKITTIDEGDEPKAFNILIGEEQEIVYEEEQTGPAYMETKEDMELLKALSREKILLLLEKSGVPEGYERKMVIVQNKIYGYREYDRTYMGSVIKEKQLFDLKEEVPDGPYLAENYIPRMLFSFNKVVLIELLKEIDEEN